MSDRRCDCPACGLKGALPQRVLQPEALPVGGDLVRAGLADVDMQRHRHQEFLCFLNAVEAAVPAELTRRRLRRGSFPSLVSLQEAINRFVEEHNRDPRPFVWTADPDAVVEKVRRGYHALASSERLAG